MHTLSRSLHRSWRQVIGTEFCKPYMVKLAEFLDREMAAGKRIYPPSAEWFNAFNSTPFNQVKVVVIGQDPYHGAGQAHGLSFSVPDDAAIPPSLLNIFKELQRDLGLTIPPQGCLAAWAQQGVLLLNATLTVEQSKAGSHQGRGWEQLTDSAIAALNSQRDGLVFLLWGKQAQRKGGMIDPNKHLVLTAPHPSPLSAYRGFIGCSHFSRTNDYLQAAGRAPIDWSLA